MKQPSMKFRFYVFLAKHFGLFFYDGFVRNAPRWMPKAYVEYSDGARSVPMPIGNCLSHIVIFNDGVLREIE